MNYIEPGNIDVNDHINIEIYKQAIDELSEENPGDPFYSEVQKKFLDYNSEELN